jgi:hypothetical protein
VLPELDVIEHQQHAAAAALKLLSGLGGVLFCPDPAVPSTVTKFCSL